MGNDEVVFGMYEGAMGVIRIDFIVGTFFPLTIYRVSFCSGLQSALDAHGTVKLPSAGWKQVTTVPLQDKAQLPRRLHANSGSF
jgi:hypothetical protein